MARSRATRNRIYLLPSLLTNVTHGCALVDCCHHASAFYKGVHALFPYCREQFCLTRARKRSTHVVKKLLERVCIKVLMSRSRLEIDKKGVCPNI